MKLRIRWYGDLFGVIEKAALEVKAKVGTVCHKLTTPIPSIRVGENVAVDNLTEVLKTSQIGDVLKLQWAMLSPSICTRYLRKYYESADRRFRVTIDSAVVYYRPRRYPSPFTHKAVDDLSIILELKYDRDKDDAAQRISNYFPFRLTKRSKYVHGIENVYRF